MTKPVTHKNPSDFKKAELKLGINEMDERISISACPDIQRIKEARLFLSRLFDLHYEDGFNEMTQSWNERLLNSISTIHENLDKIPPDKIEMYKAAIRRGETCLEDMEVVWCDSV